MTPGQGEDDSEDNNAVYIITPGMEYEVQFAVMSWVSGPVLHDTTMALGVHKSKPARKIIYFSGSAQDTFSIPFTPLAAGSHGYWTNPPYTDVVVNLKIYIWNGSSFSEGTASMTTIPAGTAGTLLGVLPAGNCYAAFTYSMSAVNTAAPVDGAIACQVGPGIVLYNSAPTSPYPYLQHLQLETLDAELPTMEKLRMVNTGAMISNRSPDMFKGGSITGYQLDPEKFYLPFVLNAEGGDVYAAVNKLNGKDNKTLDKGMHSRMKLVDLDSLQMGDSFSYDTDNKELTRFEYNIAPREGSLVIAANTPVPVMGTSYSQAYNLEVGNSVDWYTESKYRQKESPRLTSAQTQAVLDAADEVPQFHDNPNHVTDILGQIAGIAKSAIPFIEEYGPTVLKGIRSLLA